MGPAPAARASRRLNSSVVYIRSESTAKRAMGLGLQPRSGERWSPRRRGFASKPWRVCRRVLAERGAEVFVNRCPRCRWVVRTPQARQCLWCGFDWHGSETRNEGRNAFAE